MSSLLYAANTAPQALTVGGVVDFGSVVRRYGNNINLSGGNVVLSGAGYYDIDTNITLTTTTAGIAILTLYKDGVAIPAATASITMAAGDTYNVSIPAIVREKCCGDDTLTLVLSGITATIVSAGATVVKI